MSETQYRLHIDRRYRPKEALLEHLRVYHGRILPWTWQLAELDRLHSGDHAQVKG